MDKYLYLATKDDFNAIEKGVQSVWNPKLSYIFRNKKLIENTLIISFDRKKIYVWSKHKIDDLKSLPTSLKDFFLYAFSHNISFSETERLGWHTGSVIPLVLDVLPSTFKNDDFQQPKIFGSLLGDFMEIQKKIRGKENNPYITQESYLATIVHELGHVYFVCSGGKYWNNDKKYNLKVIDIAAKLYESTLINLDKSDITIPGYQSLSELFAFCTDYSASCIFWPNHRNNLDRYYKEKLAYLTSKETLNDLNTTNSVVDDPHNFACVVGKILLSKYPKIWPDIIIKKGILTV